VRQTCAVGQPWDSIRCHAGVSGVTGVTSGNSVRRSGRRCPTVRHNYKSVISETLSLPTALRAAACGRPRSFRVRVVECMSSARLDKPPSGDRLGEVHVPTIGSTSRRLEAAAQHRHSDRACRDGMTESGSGYHPICPSWVEPPVTRSCTGGPGHCACSCRWALRRAGGGRRIDGCRQRRTAMRRDGADKRLLPIRVRSITRKA
jgi:hypothetical protein